jgi:thymidylate synthase ThyX
MFEDYEEFTPQQLTILSQYVSHTSSNVFALTNLPEVIKGALFSRYSRSNLGLRSLLLKEFILNEETGFDGIVGTQNLAVGAGQTAAIKKAQNFYDRILDGYGDDSIGELGGTHLALENISILAAKEVEDCRIGGSPLEKSTRYVYFDQKHKGEYLFYREPTLMTSAFRDLYVKTCTSLFETYSRLIPHMTTYMESKFPKAEGISQGAYQAALRAKVLDCLRGLLPCSTLTNMGVFGNGRFFETLIQKLNAHSLLEMQELGKKSFQELSKVIPSFIRRAEADHRYQKSFSQYLEKLSDTVKKSSRKWLAPGQNHEEAYVKLVHFDHDGVDKMIAAFLFAKGDSSLDEIKKVIKELSSEDKNTFIESIGSLRENRRHKSPRALEHFEMTFEIVADYGVFRDLQRHRTLTQERQLLTCDLGYYIPEEILGTEVEHDYREAMQQAKDAYDLMAVEFPEEAQYAVPMGYNVRWYFHINLRALQWMTELRSQPQGHPTYRLVAQEMVKQLLDVRKELEPLFKFVDFEGYSLGRLNQEIRNEQKMKARVLV